MLKSLVKIINSCIIFFFICFALAVIFEFVNFPHSHLLQEFFIGTACSFIVVVFSTFVQYKVELKKQFYDYISAASHLIFRISLISDYDEEMNEKLIEFFYDDLENQFEIFRNAELALVFFTKKETEKRFKQNNELHTLYFRFLKNQFESHKFAVLSAYDKDLIIRAIEKYQHYWPDCYQKDHIIMVKKWLVNKIKEKEMEKTCADENKTEN